MPVQTWTGAYIGGTAGYGWGNSNSNITAIDTNFIPGWQSEGTVPTSLNPRFKGFIGGGEVGYNWQFGHWVTGLEADFSYSGLRGDASHFGPAIFADPSVLTSQRIDLSWFGTARARMGYLAGPDTLLFATGGLAYGQVKVSTGLVPDLGAGLPCAAGAACSSGSTSETRVGWTVGGGVETKIASGWTAKVEYLHFDLGRVSDTAHSTAFFNGLPIVGVTSDVKGDIVRVGVNYQFGGAGIAY
jgi:outer membrane immunogenic protein